MRDRSHHLVSLPDWWSEQRKISFLDIQLQNWNQPQLVKSFTSRGFEVRTIPENLFQYLLENVNMTSALPETCFESGHVNCNPQDSEPKFEMLRMNYTALIASELGEYLKQTVESWSKVPLEITTIYGARKYRRGATLALHVDKLSTHVVSLIINIGQEVDQGRDWRLDILDNNGRGHQVVLNKGQMLLYESARLPHGRTEPLHGDHYSNIFVHFKPANVTWYTDNDMWKWM